MRSAALAALLLLAACSTPSRPSITGTVTTTGSDGAQTATVQMLDNLTFRPNNVEARIGDVALAVTNAGQVSHNLVFSTPGVGATETVNGGATATMHLHFTTAGTYRFTCTFHRGMDGQVVVSAGGGS